MRKWLILFHLCLFFYSAPVSADDLEPRSLRSDTLRLLEVSPIPNKSRIRLVNYTVAAVYPASMAWLYTQWYMDYPQSSFHFFDDSKEWLQVDKFAHVWDAYSISKPLMKLFYWSGLEKKKSALYGAGIAYLFQTTIEVFDGFSAEWGFSAADAIANTAGVGIFLGQEFFWEDQRIALKYSFHQTKYAKYRPDLLGSNVAESILKDYNGLTCWMSINPHSFMKESSRFPKWLSIAFGYAAEGMTGGYSNPATVDGVLMPSFERYRQYYISIDFDLARIDTRSKFLGSLFKIINIIHLPAPAIEFNERHPTKLRALYF